jgi:nucleoid DNA-binding protein
MFAGHLRKEGIIAVVASRTGLPQRDVGSVLAHTVDVMTEALADGEGVHLTAFGFFEPVLRRGRQGTLPGGHIYETAPAVRVRFRMSKGLKRRLNDG